MARKEIDPVFDNLSIVTNINYSIDRIKKLNNISYVFNPSWDAESKIKSTVNTLPMSLLFITGLKEIGQSNVSTEQLILYKDTDKEDKVEEKRVGAPQSVLNVIADNIVNTPRQWQVDAILPAKYDSLINSSFNYSPFSQNVPKEVEYAIDPDVSKGKGEHLISSLSAISATSFAIADVISLISTLMPVAGALKGGLITSILNGSSYNKDSLIDMWLSRAIIKFKPPMEWNYKTVVITSFDISKRPTENDCYRLNMTLQEVPIVTTGFYTGLLEGIKDDDQVTGTSVPIKYIGNALKAALNFVGTERGQ